MSQADPVLTLVLQAPQDPEEAYQKALARLRAGESVRVEAGDLLSLRVRLGVVLGDLSPDQVRLVFGATEIHLDSRGTPSEWPRGLFSEPLALFQRLRRALPPDPGSR